MADPRGSAGFTGINGPYITVKFDSSIPVPGFLFSTQNYGTVALGGPSVSNAIGMAVTDVSTSSYSSPADAVTYGLGKTGDPVAGVVVSVNPDGFGTVQRSGMVECSTQGSNANPAINGPCACDGFGNVIAASSDDKFAKALCRGYKNSWVRNKFVHLSGLITPPTTPNAGDIVAIIEML